MTLLCLEHKGGVPPAVSNAQKEKGVYVLTGGRTLKKYRYTNTQAQIVVIFWGFQFSTIVD